MTTQPDLVQTGVLLDTNVLHYLRVYLDVAKERSLKPYGPTDQWLVINKQLKVASLLASQRKSIKDGFDAFCFLQERARNDDRIVVSPLALAEITHGLVEGQAHIKMAEVGMPYRMRQSRADLRQLVAAWVSASGYEQVRQATEGLLPELENLLGASIWLAGGGSTSRDVLALLRLVLESVHFDIVDAWLYAESLVEQVRFVLTFDKDFRNTINWIYKPGGAPNNDEGDLSSTPVLPFKWQQPLSFCSPRARKSGSSSLKLFTQGTPTDESLSPSLAGELFIQAGSRSSSHSRGY